MITTSKKLYLYSTGILGLRSEDVWFPSYPKAGNTWLRFILCNIISQSELNGAPVDFHSVGEIMSALGRHNLLLPWRHHTLPRFIKTHQPYRPLLFARPQRIVYLVRDPRDVMVSFYHYEKAKSRKPYNGEFADFLRDQQFGLARCLHHYRSWRPYITYLLRYEELKANPLLALKQTFKAIDVQIHDSILSTAIENSSLQKIQELQKANGIPGGERFTNQFVFARQGKPGGWVEYFSSTDLQYYRDMVQRFQFDLYN